MKKLISILLCVSILISMLSVSFTSVAAVSSTNVAGFIAPIEKADASAIQIKTADDLNNIRNNMYGSYVLMNDIDMSDYGNWSPIGITLSSPFYGKFDGQGHKITGLTVSHDFSQSVILGYPYVVGLFGVCDGAQIKNVYIEDADMYISTSTGYNYSSHIGDTYDIYAGIVSGYATNNTVVYNCHTSGKVNAYAYSEGYSSTIAGGIIGCADNSIISYSYNSADVNSTYQSQITAYDALAGGITGKFLNDGNIDKCYNTANVVARTYDFGNAIAGGIVGKAVSSELEITDCFNEADISGLAGNLFCDQAHAGGIAGDFQGLIDRTYNSGAVAANANDPYGISSSTAYVGGICASSTSDSTISNSAILNSTTSASASGKKYQYRISYGGTKSNNITVSTVTSGSTNDANNYYDVDSLKSSDVYQNLLGWDFVKVWEMVSGKYFPQLRQVDSSGSEYQSEYIQQHLDYINSSNYSDILNNCRWAQIYWSKENNTKSNNDEKLYNGVDTAVNLLTLNFGELFDNGNPYKIILADYVADQTVAQEVEHLYEIELPTAIEKTYSKVTKFIEDNWEDAWGELSDEDLFYLFHYKEQTPEKWINLNFEEHIEEIVYDTRHSGDGFETALGIAKNTFDTILEQKDNLNNIIEWLNGLIDYSAEVSAYVNASEEFKEILEQMCFNLPENTTQEKSYKAQLLEALDSYVQYNNSEYISEKIFANYVSESIGASISAKIEKLFKNQVNGWLESALSETALLKLKALQWTVDTAWKICEYITKNGELQECREMLRANAYFESAMYNTLKSIETQFKTDSTIENACLFDAAFKFFKETEIYSMDVMISYCDTYQTSWAGAIKNNLSNTFMNSLIEEIQINKLFLYNTYCHGNSYSIGGKVITVACPTDVHLYDSEGNLAVAIENNKVVYCSNNLLAYTSDSIKLITVPSNYSYNIKISATDSGSMSYSVSEYDENKNNVQTTVYKDIELNQGDSFTGVINDEINTQSDTYNLVSDDNITIDNYDNVDEVSNIPVKSISIENKAESIRVDDTLVLNASILPDNSTIKSIAWTSSDENVATVNDSGIVVAKQVGTTTITAQSLYGGVSDSMELTVVEKDCPFYITHKSENAVYKKDTIANPITVQYYIEGDSSVDVQWYKSTDKSMEEKILLYGAKELSFVPSTDKVGTYYYCAQLVSDYGLIYSNPIKIEIIEKEIIASGQYSENVNWEIDSENNLYVSGSGALELNDDSSYSNWNDYADKIVSVEIGNGITEVSKDVLASLTSVKSIKVDKSVLSIAEGAFSTITSLEEVELPFIGTSNDAVDESAVFGAIFGKISSDGVLQYYKLDGTQLYGYRYNIPASLRKVKLTNEDSVAFGAFYNCSSITDIELNEGITSLGQYSFCNCKGITSFTVPDSVTEVEEYALSGCENIEVLTLPFVGADVDKNGTYDSPLGHIFGRSSSGVIQYSILEDSSLSGYSYDIPSSLQDIIITSEKEIPIGAFCNCSMLKSITLNKEVNKINMYAFYNCSALSSIYYYGTEDDWGNMNIDSTGNDPLISVDVSYIKPINRIGDVDGDGYITIIDVTEIQKYLAQFSELTEEQLICADTDKNGKINIKDATIIQMYLADHITELE